MLGDCGYWPYTLGRSVGLYTGECVVNSSMGLWDHADIQTKFWLHPVQHSDGGGRQGDGIYNLKK